MEIFDRIWGLLTNVTWVSSRQSYRISGPPNSYSSAEITISRGRLVAEGDKNSAQKELDDEVERACQDRIPQVVNALVEMVEEHQP
jgi:hypothetical protein